MSISAKFDILKKQFESGEHSHAYLFSGIFGNKEQEDVLALAQILTGYSETGKNNPDILFIIPDTSLFHISLGEIKNIARFLSFKPYSGKNKVVIINQFHHTSKEASSALLKILEEPPDSSIIILLSEYPAMILPTILSRVQKIYFPHIQKEIDKNKDLFYSFNTLIYADFINKFSFIEDYVKKGKDVNLLLEMWILFFYDMSHILIGENNSFLSDIIYKKEMEDMLKQKKYTISQIITIIKNLLYWKHIACTTNVNKRLLLENIVLTF